MAVETRQAIRGSATSDGSTVLPQITFRLKAYSLYGSSALESFLAVGARVVCHATRIQILELGKHMYRVPQEFLCEEDYTETVAAVYELFMNFHFSY